MSQQKWKEVWGGILRVIFPPIYCARCSGGIGSVAGPAHRRHGGPEDCIYPSSKDESSIAPGGHSSPCSQAQTVTNHSHLLLLSSVKLEQQVPSKHIWQAHNKLIKIFPKAGSPKHCSIPVSFCWLTSPSLQPSPIEHHHPFQLSIQAIPDPYLMPKAYYATLHSSASLEDCRGGINCYNTAVTEERKTPRVVLTQQQRHTPSWQRSKPHTPRAFLCASLYGCGPLKTENGHKNTTCKHSNSLMMNFSL